MTYTHLVISRPQPEAGQLAEYLADSSLVPLVMPAYAFAAAKPGYELEDFRSAHGRKLAVFTSKRAVHFGLAQFPDDLLQGTGIAAIGPATAALLEEHGLPVSLAPVGGFTSEDLLAAPELEHRPGAALVVTAPGGRTALRRGLAARGWTVFVTHVYRREELEPSASAVKTLLSARAVISTWTSENAMKSLAARLPEPAWRIICRGQAVVTSERLGRAMQKLGAGGYVVANGPGNQAIAETVRQLT